MIRVQPQPEPPEFDKLVRQPGLAYLQGNAKPTHNQWKSHSYWRKIIPQLRKSYKEICAYCCHWIPPDTGSSTVEHFLSKDKYQKQAYQWDNYRLVSGPLNGRKGTREDILDPFQIQNGWFVIRCPNRFLVVDRFLDSRCQSHLSYAWWRSILNEKRLI